MDGTLGHGGHAEMFLGLGADVLGIDRDPEALRIARARLGARLRTLEAPYASEAALAAVAEFRPDFILLDLGVSSKQLDDDQRGFTFRPGAPLDMRMGNDGPTAGDLLKHLGLGHRLDHRPARLSGGEQQRVAIARAVVGKPDLLLADEPTGNLDEKTAEIVFGELTALVRNSGIGALIATHNLDLARRMDRVVTLHEGRLQAG